jgi:hypothetical protein
MHTFRLAIFSTLLLAFHSGVQAQACPGGVCPPVVVTAPTGSGSNIICRGSACAGILASMQEATYFEMPLDQQGPIEPTDIPVDRGLFCANLKVSKPAGCGSVAPPVPLLNTTIASYINNNANGCGDGSWSAIFGNAIAQLVLGDYSGDPNAPIAGVSFRSACNAHDACYAGQGVRDTCDTNFSNALNNICNGTGTVAPTCRGYANAYSAAVRLGGESAYVASYVTQQCALWHKNMEQNSCPK